jgi:hypothetical protein
MSCYQTVLPSTAVRTHGIFVYGQSSPPIAGKDLGLVLRIRVGDEVYRLIRERLDKTKSCWVIKIGTIRKKYAGGKYCKCSQELARFLYWLATHEKFLLCAYVMERRYAQGMEAAEELRRLYWDSTTRVDADLLSDARAHFIHVASVG